MRIIIDIGHPAHVHHFKCFYEDLLKRDHKILFATRDKECAIELLDAYGLPYKIIGKSDRNVIKKIVGIVVSDIKLLKISLEFKPDVFISRVSPSSAHISSILRKPHICYADTETSKGFDWIATPGVDVFLTSTTYQRDHGKRQIRYNGYHELAYLQPNRYTPNQDIYKRLGLNIGDKYAIVRFVSWHAHHDIGQKGLSVQNKLRLVEELSKQLKVLISSEGILSEELLKYQIKIKPEMMHDVLNYAHLYVGESSTMASESVMLGTPAIFINNNKFGCTEEQKKYGLLFQYSESEEDQEKLIQKAIELAKEETKDEFIEKRDLMLRDKIDVTAFMVWFVENYPESFRIMKEDPGYQDRFR